MCRSVQNLIKKRWNPGEDADEADTPLHQEDKDRIKQVILGLMCNVPANVQKQLSEALSIISTHDFPGEPAEQGSRSPLLLVSCPP